MSCFAKTLLIAVAALVGLSQGRKSKSASQASSPDINWLLGLENPLPLEEKPEPATSDQAPGFLTQHDSQEVSVSDASQLDVSQLTSVTLEPESASMKPESVTMKPKTALISQKSQSSQSVAGGSHTLALSKMSAAAPDDVLLRDLEQTIMSLAKKGNPSNVTIAAVEDIEEIIDNMTQRIFAISDGYRAAVHTAQKTIDDCLKAWGAIKESGNYPPSVCALVGNADPTAATAILPRAKNFGVSSTATNATPREKKFKSLLEMGMTHGGKIVSHRNDPATCTHLLVQSSSANNPEIILDHNQGITFGTLLKLDAGGASEEIVEVKSFGAIVRLEQTLVFDHAVGECVDIFAFGTDYYDHLSGVSCDRTAHCNLSTTASSYDHLVDPEPLRECRGYQEAIWKQFEEKRAPLYSMGLLRDDLCGIFSHNSSDGNWPDKNVYCAPQTLDNMGGFYNDTGNYYLAFYTQLTEENKTCTEARNNYNAVAEEAASVLKEWQHEKAVCDSVQNNMDNKACDARENQGHCELGYGDCYYRQVDHTLSEYVKANVTAFRYMDEMRSILRVRCLLDALLAPSSTQVDTKIEACSHAIYFQHPNVTYLDVHPPSIPCPGQCESLPYQPGTLSYANVFYEPYQDKSHPCAVRCCYDTTLVFSLDPIFVLGSFGADACPTGTLPIEEIDLCERAQGFFATTLNSTITTWQGQKNSADWPSYCHQVSGTGAPGIWWNTVTTGSSSLSARPICKDMYITGPKATRAAVATWCQNTRMPLPITKQLCDQHDDCEVILGDDCDDGSSNWFYCRTTIDHILSGQTSPILDACTKVKIAAAQPTTTNTAPVSAGGSGGDFDIGNAGMGMGFDLGSDMFGPPR